MGEQHLGVAQHGEHLQGGDRQIFSNTLTSDGDAGRLLRCLHKQGTGQGLIADRREHQTEQIGKDAPLQQTACLTAGWTNAAVEGTAEPHDQPSLPEAEQEHEKRQCCERETRAETHGPVSIPGDAAADVVEQQDPDHHHTESGLNPEADPGGATQAKGQQLEVKPVGHAGMEVCRPNLPSTNAQCTAR